MFDDQRFSIKTMGAPYLSYISWYFMDSRSHKHGQTLDGCVWKLAHASKIIMLPSGKTNSLLLKKAIEIVDFPIKNGDFP